MKKGAAIFAILFVISAIVLAGAFTSATSQTDSVQKAYTCLNNQIDNKTCSKLSTSEKIFSLLSTGKCKTELLNDSFNKNNTCWSSSPTTNCDVGTTAQAALALDHVGVDTTLPENWILSQKGVSSDLNWFLEIDGSTALGCKVGYNKISNDSSSYTEYNFQIDQDKKIIPDAGQASKCLSLANSDYWFQVDPSCYQNEFQISCNDTFVSTLLYQEKGSSTYHLSPEVHSSSGGTTTEIIDSSCFLNGGVCDYAGTLWGASVLKILGKNVTEFLPYLEINSKNFENTFPESFLYLLTQDLGDKSNLLKMQNLDGFWRVDDGKSEIYDTALALLPFKGFDLNEKTKAKTKLLDPTVQGPEGCWDNKNIVSTGFVLYSLWPSNAGGGGDGQNYCTDFQDVGYSCVNSSVGCSTGEVQKTGFICGENAQICCAPDTNGGSNLCEEQGKGYTCTFASQCGIGQTVSGYDCLGSQVCCDTSQTPTVTCADKGGQICQNGQYCSDSSGIKTDDLLTGQTCCLSGTCKVQNNTPTYTCEPNLGVCSSSCSSGYTENSAYTCDSGNVCCFSSGGSSSGGSYWWIWVLFFLVILVVVGIIYRDKIKEYLDKMKAKKGGRGDGSSMNNNHGMPPRFPPGYSRATRFSPSPPRRMVQESRPPQRFAPRPKSPKELDDVLKKLKEIGK